MINELTDRYPALKSSETEIKAAVSLLTDCFEKKGKLLLCGNGGSSSDCEHISGELMKGFLKRRPISEEQKLHMQKNCPQLDESELKLLQCGLPAIPLTSLSALNTAFGNDASPELSFAQGVMALGREGDVLFAISTSGSAKNVIAAAKVAKGIGMKVIALTGRDGGKLKAFSDVVICVDETETYKIQELHLPTYHYICSEVEKHFFEVSPNSLRFCYC